MKARRLLKFGLPVVLAVVFFVAMTGSAFANPSTLQLSVSAGGQTFGVPISLAASPSAPATDSVVDTASVTAWIHAVAGQVNCKPANITYTVNKTKKRLDFKPYKVGYTLQEPASVTLLCNALRVETSVTPPGTLALPTTNKNPTKMKFGKTILVVQSLHTIYLYDNSKVIKTYRCAVGMRAYPTPNGAFHIGKKVKNPTWTNGGAAWSSGMPSFIGPSPNNPLGTRALYVYTGTTAGKGHDTGVRFHGVPPSENSSIGHSLSHGCLRMHRKDVEAFFPIVPMNTIVYIIK